MGIRLIDFLYEWKEARKYKLDADHVSLLFYSIVNDWHKQHGVDIDKYYGHRYEPMLYAYKVAEKLKIVKHLEDNKYIATDKMVPFLISLIPHINSYDDAAKEQAKYSNVKIGFTVFIDLWELKEQSMVGDLNYYISNQDYDLIKKVLKKYQRNSDIKLLKQLRRFSGEQGELFGSSPMVLYRGILVHNVTMDDVRSKIIDINGTSYSWSKSINIVRRFAYGNDSWAGAKKCVSKGNIGVIFKHKFERKEIIIDFNFANEYNKSLKGFADFPTELEVIVVPKKRAKYEVVEYLTNECKKRS